MKTSFVAFLNKHGIACASDTDMTLYALSRQEPVALAVNSYSPIPWDSIINSYLRKGDIPLHELFSDYVNDFNDYLSKVESKPEWKNLTYDERNIIFLGFGTDDVFPSGVDVEVCYDETRAILTCAVSVDHTINHRQTSSYYTLSKFENVQSILLGMTEERSKVLKEKYSELFNIFQNRIKEAVKNTKYEEELLNYLKENDNKIEFARRIDYMCKNQEDDVFMAIDSFNIEDLVTVAENIVDAHDQLEHLKTVGKYPLKQTKELAVITRTEGLVWIKHSLYAV